MTELADYVAKTTAKIEDLLKVEIVRGNGKAIYTPETEPRIRRAAALYRKIMERFQELFETNKSPTNKDFIAVSSVYRQRYNEGYGAGYFKRCVARARDLETKDQTTIRVDILFGVGTNKLRDLKLVSETLSKTARSKIDDPQTWRAALGRYSNLKEKIDELRNAFEAERDRVIAECAADLNEMGLSPEVTKLMGKHIGEIFSDEELVDLVAGAKPPKKSQPSAPEDESPQTQSSARMRL